MSTWQRPPASPAEEQLAFHQQLYSRTPRVFVTYAVIGINVIVFAGMLAMGVSPMSPSIEDLLRFGADYGPYTVDGQWWRVLSSTFLHSGILHIGFNMYALWNAGRLAERLYGNVAYAGVYLLAGLGGSLASLIWKPTIVSVGASGAIFGVYGALFAFITIKRGQIPMVVLSPLRSGLLTFIGYNLIFGFTQPFIDNAAHVGGLVTGFVAGALVARDLGGDDSGSVARLARLLLVIGALVGLSRLAVARVEALPAMQSDRAGAKGVEAADKGDYADLWIAKAR
jgi:rhomboid protease GluP